MLFVGVGATLMAMVYNDSQNSFCNTTSFHTGANIRCCYDEPTGAIIDDRLCRSAGEGTDYDMMGVLHRYQVVGLVTSIPAV